MSSDSRSDIGSDVNSDISTDSDVNIGASDISSDSSNIGSDTSFDSNSTGSDISSDISSDGCDMAQQCSITFMKQAYYASCIVVCVLLLCKLAELGLTNTYYGFSAAWIAPRLAFWDHEQLEHRFRATGSLYECVSIPGDSALCKSFANLFDKVRLGSSLNNVKITAIAADGQVSYDYWSSQYSIFIIVTKGAYEDAVW